MALYPQNERKQSGVAPHIRDRFHHIKQNRIILSTNFTCIWTRPPSVAGWERRHSIVGFMHMYCDRKRDKQTNPKNREAYTRQSYLSSSDGHLGLLIYRLVTETAYHQQPRPSAHAHREGLIWIFEGKTHTHTPSTQIPACHCSPLFGCGCFSMV